MAEPRLSTAAATDLEEIFIYSIQTFGLAQAQRYRESLKECLSRIAGNRV